MRVTASTLRTTFAASITALLAFASTASAANVYVFSTGNPAADAAYASTLTAQGHTVTIGGPWSTFDGTVSLNGFDVVLMNHGANWVGLGEVPVAGQQQLVAFVTSGGGLITTEWLVYNHGVYGGAPYATLMPIVPVTYGSFWNGAASTTLSVVEPDSVLNDSLPDTFDIPLVNFAGGTETRLTARDGAAIYYRSSNISSGSIVGAGVAGWIVGEGRVMSFSSMPGPDSLANPNYATLLGNAVDWATLGQGPCGYDYNRDEVIDLMDAQQMAQVFVGLIPADPTWLDGDFNGDENADLTDARLLAQYVVSGICPF